MAVDKLVDSTQLDADLTSVANAIRTKGGTSSQLAFPSGFVSAVQAIPTGTTPTGTKQISITQNGTTTEDVTDYASAEITVNVSSGGTEVESKDVDFIDYDGTIVESYTAQEFAALSALPSNPSHTGLTSQGWNWALQDAKTYVQNHGGLVIGQMYIPTDEKTKVKIHMDGNNLSPYLGLGLNGTAVIDWGDNSSDTVTGSSVATAVHTQHTYAEAGDYTISIAVTGSANILGEAAGTYLLWEKNTSAPNSKVYRTAIKEINIGKNVNFSNNYSLTNCFCLKAITLPYGLTSLGAGLAFQNCFDLVALVIPSGVTLTTSNMCIACESLIDISLPYGLTALTANTVTNCHSLTRLYTPDSVTTFGGSTGLSRLKTLAVPINTADIPAFSAAYSLRTIEIPSSAARKFLAAALMNCWGLENITIPSGVTSIAANAFNTCQSLQYIKFEGNTPPVVDASTAFTGLPTSCKILVPTGKLSAYTSASNYPSSSTYTYQEY